MMNMSSSSTSSPALFLPLSKNPTCNKTQEVPKHTQISKPVHRQNQCVKTQNSHLKLTKRNLLSSAALGLTSSLGTFLARPARAEPEAPIKSTSNRVSYSRFLQYLDEDMVRKVDLFEKGTVAIAEVFNSTLGKMQRVKVNLPGLPADLVRKMKEKNVDFAAHPTDVNWGAFLLDSLGNFGFPLLLLGSLLLRSSSPVGPNLPFGLGRSKARFQMEPNTGVTFDDVAGVDKAKQDFQEIVRVFENPGEILSRGG